MFWSLFGALVRGFLISSPVACGRCSQLCVFHMCTDGIARGSRQLPAFRSL